MPLTSPKHQPGAKLRPEDTEFTARADHTGRVGPYFYAAVDHTENIRPDHVRARVWKDGKPVRMAGLRKRPRLHSTFASVEALRHFLLRKVRKRRVPSSGEVPDYTDWKEEIKQRKEQRRCERAVNVETEHYGGAAHHRIVS